MSDQKALPVDENLGIPGPTRESHAAALDSAGTSVIAETSIS